MANTNGKEPKAKGYEGLVEKNEVNSLANQGTSKRIWRIYSRSLTIVSRELSALRKLSIGGKLNADNASDLAMYVKLLGEILKQKKTIKKDSQEEDEAELLKMTDAELEARALKILKGKKK